jgi:hypothetical protein
VINSVKV